MQFTLCSASIFYSRVPAKDELQRLEGLHQIKSKFGGHLAHKILCIGKAKIFNRFHVDSHALTGVALTVSGFACPATALLETALTHALTGGELPRN
jgi:hypothetical protein